MANGLAKRVFRWILKGASAITYRDDNTRKLGEACGVEKPMYHTADSGFWLLPALEGTAEEIIHRAGKRDQGRSFIALTPHMLFFTNHEEVGKHFNPKSPEQYDQEIDCFATAVDWLWERGYQPIFVPMNTVAPDDDRIAARKVMERAKFGKCALLIDEEVKPRVAPVVFKQCSFSIVARVHGSITSAIGNCPVIMYAFAPKHEGIMKPMELDRYILMETEASPAKMIELISHMEFHREEVCSFLPERLEKLRQEGLIPFSLMIQILDRPPPKNEAK